MKIGELYPSKYVKSDDIKGQRLQLQVGKVVMEDIADNEIKPVMYFNGKEKGMVLNKTNAMLCAHCWGDETDAWAGQWLDLFVEPKMFQGKVVDGISVAPKLPNSQSAPAQPAAPEPPPQAPGPDGIVDDIPF